jgi:hypothetical protein
LFNIPIFFSQKLHDMMILNLQIVGGWTEQPESTTKQYDGSTTTTTTNTKSNATKYDQR